METKANYAIVGFFTVFVIAAAFGFVYWMAQYGRAGEMVELVVNIPGSANGLSVGSPVRFNGINVGTVRNLAIDANDPRYSIAITEVSADAPVLTSTRATLEVQGLTGAAYIELSGGRKGDENILKRTSPPTSRASPACLRPLTRSSTGQTAPLPTSRASSPTSANR
jgi:phospholipid/cholesterol/gamma-HCH transport system substrate-binding protein